jgi:hypothetical protein
MPIEQIAEKVLEDLHDQKPHEFSEVIQKIAKQTSAYPADVKSAVLAFCAATKWR